MASNSPASEMEHAIDLSWVINLVDSNNSGPHTPLVVKMPLRDEPNESSGYSSSSESASLAAFNCDDKQQLSRGFPTPDSYAIPSCWNLWNPLNISTPLDLSMKMKDHFSIRPSPPLQQAGSLAFFFIEQNKKMLVKPKRYDMEDLVIIVQDPFGNNLPTMRKKDPRHENVIVCSFRPLCGGLYGVSVTNVASTNDHIEGSPFQVAISRNYTLDKMMTIANFSVMSAATERPVKTWGIACNYYNDILYVCDRESHCINVHRPDGTLLGRIGSPGQLFRPTGISCDHRNNRLIVTDKDNHRVAMYSFDGKLIRTFGQKGHKNGEFSYPWGVAVSPCGNKIVVADSRNHRMQLFDTNGEFLDKFSVFENNPFEYKSKFNYPRGVAYANDGRHIFVTDFNMHNVHRIQDDMIYEKKLIPDGHLSRPQGIAVDPVGNLLVCDSRHNNLRVVSPDGDLLSTVESLAAKPIHAPVDVTIMRGGRVAVVQYDGTVRIF